LLVELDLTGLDPNELLLDGRFKPRRDFIQKLRHVGDPLVALLLEVLIDRLGLLLELLYATVPASVTA
jgi:hypothetical protein